ncbi:MAG: FxsA family protein [Cytophagales bacterium]|nr:FxsA family protein [Cytophagales bacterium]
MVYILGCILIGLPGVTTDLIGFMLVLPPISSAISNYMTKSANIYQPSE